MIFLFFLTVCHATNPFASLPFAQDVDQLGGDARQLCPSLRVHHGLVDVFPFGARDAATILRSRLAVFGEPAVLDRDSFGRFDVSVAGHRV